MEKKAAVMFILIIAVLCSTAAFAAKEDIVMVPSVEDAGCKIGLTSSSYLINSEEEIKLTLDVLAYKEVIMGMENTHKRWAKYHFDKCFYSIYVEGYKHNSGELIYSFKEPGDYTAEGAVLFRWKTDTAKVNAGFPRYYYKSVSVKKIIRVREMPDELPPEQTDSADDDAENPYLTVMVYHTEGWDRNRQRYNEYYRKRNMEDRLRDESVFWSGEKFMVMAAAGGGKVEKISASIQGTRYETALREDGGVWTGSIFDENMIGRWGSKEPEKLIFIFEAEIDGIPYESVQRVTLDDRWPYYQLHRRE